jgi:hypothetical protein
MDVPKETASPNAPDIKDVKANATCKIARLRCVLPFVKTLAGFTDRYALTGYSPLVFRSAGVDFPEISYMLCRLYDTHGVSAEEGQTAYALVRIEGSPLAEQVTGAVIGGREQFVGVSAGAESEMAIRSAIMVLRRDEPASCADVFEMSVICVARVLTPRWLLTGYALLASPLSGGRAVEFVVCRLYDSEKDKPRSAIFVATYEGMGPGGKKAADVKIARNPVPTLKDTAYSPFAKSEYIEICEAIATAVLVYDVGSAMVACKRPGAPLPPYLREVPELRPSGSDIESSLAIPDVGVQSRASDVDVQNSTGGGH